MKIIHRGQQHNLANAIRIVWLLPFFLSRSGYTDLKFENEIARDEYYQEISDLCTKGDTFYGRV